MEKESPTTMHNSQQHCEYEGGNLKEVHELLCQIVQQGASRYSLLDCPERFHGNYGSDAINRFIQYVEAYKAAKNISDEQCLREFPLLLAGTAYTWYHSNIGMLQDITWRNVITFMRQQFAQRRPIHEIFMDLYKPFKMNTNEQQSTQISLLDFIEQKMYLLAQLPKAQRPGGQTQVDMIYAVLPLDVQSKIPRGELSTIQSLMNLLRKYYSQSTLPDKDPPLAIGQNSTNEVENENILPESEDMADSHVVNETSNEKNHIPTEKVKRQATAALPTAPVATSKLSLMSQHVTATVKSESDATTTNAKRIRDYSEPRSFGLARTNPFVTLNTQKITGETVDRASEPLIKVRRTDDLIPKMNRSNTTRLEVPVQTVKFLTEMCAQNPAVLSETTQPPVADNGQHANEVTGEDSEAANNSKSTAAHEMATSSSSSSSPSTSTPSSVMTAANIGKFTGTCTEPTDAGQMPTSNEEPPKAAIKNEETKESETKDTSNNADSSNCDSKKPPGIITTIDGLSFLTKHTVMRGCRMCRLSKHLCSDCATFYSFKKRMSRNKTRKSLHQAQNASGRTSLSSTTNTSASAAAAATATAGAGTTNNRPRNRVRPHTVRLTRRNANGTATTTAVFSTTQSSSGGSSPPPKCHQCGTVGFYRSICPICRPISLYKVSTNTSKVQNLG